MNCSKADFSRLERYKFVPFLSFWHILSIYSNSWWLFCSIVIHMSALWWGLTALILLFTWVWRKGPSGPPKYEKIYIYFHILGLNLNISYRIASLFDMYIDMGERIAGKEDRPSLIMEDPLRAPQIAQNVNFFTLWPIYGKLVFKLFPLVVHLSPLWWGLHLLTFLWPWYPWILCKGPTWPNIFFFSYFLF